jgi:putative transposase
MKYDPRRHHRRSIRLKGYDYRQPGAYFVTICTCQREELFGQIVDGEMQLSPLGELIKREWFRSAQMRREIELFDDELVIMPNHIHGIVHIVEVGVGVDGVHPDETRPDDVDKPGAHHAGARWLRLWLVSNPP